MKCFTRAFAGLAVMTILIWGSVAFAQDVKEESQGSNGEHGTTYYRSTYDHIPVTVEPPQMFFPNPEETEKDEDEQHPIPNSGAIIDDADQEIPTDFRAIITNTWQTQGVNGWIPPDPAGAIGPSDIICANNDDFRIYSRAGVQLFTTDINDFVGLFDRNYFDPKVIYDPWAGRFVIVYMYVDQNTTAANSLTGWLVLYSDDSSASGGWGWIHLNAGVNGSTQNSEWADYPYIGYDDDAYILSARMFGWFGSSSDYGKIRFIAKADLFNGGGIAWWDMWNLTSDGTADRNVVPVQMNSNPGQAYVISAKSSGGSTLTLRRYADAELMSSPGPTLSDSDVVTVNNYASPPNADQPGGIQDLDTIDTRLLGATYYSGRVHTTHNTGYDWGSGTRSAIKMYMLSNAATPVVLWDNIFGATTADYYYPQITNVPADPERAYVCFARSNSSVNAEFRFTARLALDSGWAGSSLIKAGEGTYIATDSFGRNRWGDYFACAYDPADNKSVAMFGEYAETGNAFGTWYARVNHRPFLLITADNKTQEHSRSVNLTATVRRDSDNAVISGVTVQFSVNSTAVGSAVTNGSGVATLAYDIPFQTPGSRTITAFAADTADYNADEDTAILTVTKHTPTMLGFNRTRQYAEDALLHGLLRDASLVGISGKTVDFTVGGTAVGSAVTDSGGDAWLNWLVNRVPGPYIIAADFAGDTWYNPASDTSTLTATIATTNLVADDVSGAIGTSVNLTATLARVHDGWLMGSGYSVSFQVGGVAVGSDLTNTSGVASLAYAVPAGVLGTSVIQADFAGTSIHAASSDTATFTKTADTNLTVVNASGQRLAVAPLSATLRRTHDNALLVGRTVNFTVDGVGAGGAVTNGSGIASVNYLIPGAFTVGAHTIGASFAGEPANFLNPSTGTGTLTVAKWNTVIGISSASGTAGQTVPFSATLTRTIDGAAVPSKTIGYTVGGVGVGSAATNASGVATLNWVVTIGTLGASPLVASFAGDADYNPSSGSATFTRNGKTLGGTVTLLDWTASRAGLIARVNVYDSANVLRDSFNATLNASGIWSRTNSTISTGNHRVEIKVWHWLNRAGVNSISASGNSSINRSLINGDVDDDNEVGPGDFGALSAAFGSVSGDANWNADADLDGDGEVGPSDFGILSANFGASGD